MIRSRLTKVLLILLTGLGVFAGSKLSLEHLQTGETCPVLGFVPACYLVFAGYLCALLATVFSSKTWSKKLFFLGWIPVFLLALSGVVLELTQGHICPPGAFGIPQCFFSFAMAVIALILFLQLLSKPRHAGESA